MLDLLLAQVPESVVVPEEAPDALLAMWADPSAARLGGAFPPELATEHGGFNARIVRASEHPGSGMVADARSLARMYAAAIVEVDGLRLLAPSTVETMCVVQKAPEHGSQDELETFFMEAFPMKMSLGFMRPTRTMPLLGGGSFGHGGAGGSLAFADPETQISFGYVMNQMKMDFATAQNLVTAVAECAC
jgi:CubicO group peptidase (beta-lactamase class C family)